MPAPSAGSPTSALDPDCSSRSSFNTAGAHTQGGWTFELSPTGAGGWQLRELQGQDWVTRYSLDEQRLHPADVVMANAFSSTYPH